MRQPGNKHDPDAIAVHITNANGRRGTQVGWIKAETADGLALRLDNGERLGAFVATLTGGEHDNRGVNIAIYKLPE